MANIDDINNRWLGLAAQYSHRASASADDFDSDLMWAADLVIDLSSDDEPLDHYSDGGPAHVLRLADGSHCAFAIKFDGGGAVAVEKGRRQAGMIAANDDELVALAYGGKVRGISSYSFYPDLKDLAARMAELVRSAGEAGYRPAEALKTGSVRELTEGLASLEGFVTAALDDSETFEAASSLLLPLQDLADDLAPARRQETVRTLLLKTLRSAAAASPPVVAPKAAAILEAQITAQAGPGPRGPDAPAPLL